MQSRRKKNPLLWPSSNYTSHFHTTCNIDVMLVYDAVDPYHQIYNLKKYLHVHCPQNNCLVRVEHVWNVGFPDLNEVPFPNVPKYVPSVKKMSCPLRL